MAAMEIFFDYNYPECRPGYKYLLEIRAQARNQPCLASWKFPGPDGPARPLFSRPVFVQDQGSDQLAYHERMFT